LRPGGRLVYCTCSVFRAEGEVQAKSFVAHNKEAVLRPAPGHLLPHSGETGHPVRDNLEGDHDGFFYAAFEKRA
jgi:16S rRNA (cytosine967-C5)-methyltransferase